jgi:signal peptidase
MEPTYYTGDLVIARCAEASVGDVIVYQPTDLGGARIIHRITGGDATTGWVMQGDNNASADPFNPAGSEVLGVATVYLPKVGLVARGLTSPFVWGSFILIAIGLFIWPRSEDDEPDSQGDAETSAGADGAPDDIASDHAVPEGTDMSELFAAPKTPTAPDDLESDTFATRVPSAGPVRASVLAHR